MSHNIKSIKVTAKFFTQVDATTKRHHTASKTVLIFSDPNEYQVKAMSKRIADGMLALAQLQHGYATEYEEYSYVLSEIIDQGGGSLAIG